MGKKRAEKQLQAVKPPLDNRVCAFARVSSKDQSYLRQLADLETFCHGRNFEIVETICEVVSGKASADQRDDLVKLLDGAKQGRFSRVVVSEISRLGRNSFQVLSIINELKTLGVSLIIQNLGIETLSEKDRTEMPLSGLFCSILSELASLEYSWRKERCASGIAAARLAGKHLGRPHGTKIPDAVILKKHSGVVRLLNRNLSIRQIAKLESISHITVIKVKKILKSQAPQST